MYQEWPVQFRDLEFVLVLHTQLWTVEKDCLNYGLQRPQIPVCSSEICHGYSMFVTSPDPCLVYTLFRKICLNSIMEVLEVISDLHVAEIPYENEWVVKTRNVDHGTVTHLNNIGVLGKNLLAAHSVWVNPREVQMMADQQVKVSHCPASAMRMLGFAPIQEMQSAGVCVSLGTDVDEMYLASLINKGKAAYTRGTTDPTALPAENILKMAAINGAQSVLWEDEIGSVEVGKKADLVILNPDLWTTLPVHDPIANIMYCMRTENIESVICDGQWIMQNCKILTVDEGQILKDAREAAANIITRASIQLPLRMKVIP
ncbi:unnamed protein product [Sphagnum balticum]